jgi:ssDNA-binding Zn-finger/Zn-ribbon topoisomerase 1
VKSPFCPKCRSPMRLKHGYSEFWGCTRYREGCRGIITMAEWEKIKDSEPEKHKVNPEDILKWAQGQTKDLFNEMINEKGVTREAGIIAVSLNTGVEIDEFKKLTVEETHAVIGYCYNILQKSAGEIIKRCEKAHKKKEVVKTENPFKEKQCK